MPDPWLYLLAIGSAALASMICMLAMDWLWKSASKETRSPLASVVGIAAGLVAGYAMLRMRITFPPVNGLDRLLVVVLPLAIGIELLAVWERAPRRLIWSLRMLLVASLGRILLHGSVYLAGDDPEWTFWQALGILTVCAVSTALLWGSLAWLGERSSPSISVTLSLAMTIVCSGLAIMLAGYVKGGAAALPLGATLVSVVALQRFLIREPNPQASVGVGIVGLSGLLIIGRFFGALTTGVVGVLLLAPLLCWVTELPGLRGRPAWVVGTLRLLLVAIPLAVVLWLAKLELDRHTAPLLSQHGYRIE